MYIKISLDASVNISISVQEYEKIVREKGKSILDFIDDFVVIDIETTGYYQFSDIIEVGALKVSKGKVIDTFQSLVKPEDFEEQLTANDYYLDSFIVNLTGITDGMLFNAPNIKDALPVFLDFVGDNVLVAHNANFDINILYDTVYNHYDRIFNNNFIDTLRVSRRVFRECKKHKLSYLAKELNLQYMPCHRALSDCYATLSLYNACRDKARLESIDLNESSRKTRIKAIEIAPENPDYFDEEHPFYGNLLVFTGALSRMTRKEAMQIVVNLGGKCSDSINKKTNYLVMGKQDYSRFSDGKDSNKTKKAKEFTRLGYPIEIIRGRFL